MSFNQIDGHFGTSAVYGFLCQQTNTFYAFQTKEEYLEFLDWLKGEAQQTSSPSCGEMLTDEEIWLNSERATSNIMEVFNDPVFQQDHASIDLE